jgi:hypothetical protein
MGLTRSLLDEGNDAGDGGGASEDSDGFEGSHVGAGLSFEGGVAERVLAESVVKQRLEPLPCL